MAQKKLKVGKAKETREIAAAPVVEPTPAVAVDAQLSAVMGSNVVQYIISSYSATRQHYRHIFRNRQPNSRSHAIYSSTAVAPFTHPTSEELVLLGLWLLDDDPAKFDVYHQAKLIITELDILLEEGCAKGKKCEIIWDMALFTPKHIAKITCFAAHIIATILNSETAVPVEVGAIYIINAPDWVSDYTELYPLLDFRIVEDVADLKRFLPEEFLPCDLGGRENAPPRKHFLNLFIQRLRRYGGWLAEQEINWDRELLIRSTENVISTKKTNKNKTRRKSIKNK